MKLKVVGNREPDYAAVDKVTGSARFISDVSLPGMLHGKVLHSPHAHAKILSVDTEKAEKLPGVVGVVTRKDVPHKLYTRNLMNLQSISGIEPFGVYDTEVLGDKVRYVGDAVAAIAAINEKVAEEAVELIEVEYEILPAVFDEMDAMKDGAPQLHHIVQRRQEDENPGNEKVERNLALHAEHVPVGDIEKGFKDADHIIEGTGYTTQQRQAPIETFSCVADFDARGKLTLWSQCQLPFLLRRMIAYVFDMQEGMIRIRNEFIGGAFGAGLVLFREPLAIVLAEKTGKPVKLKYSRQEEFSDRPTRSSMGPYKIKMGVKNDGSITAIERSVISQAGGYLTDATLSSLIATSAGGPLYRSQSSRAVIDSVYTNKVDSGAMRGFGNPEETFVREQVVDLAAEKTGMDPMEFRLKNFCQIGDPGPFGPDFPITSNAIAECLASGAEMFGWKEKCGEKKEGVRKRGVGLSCLAHVSGAWPVHAEHSNASIRFNEGGTINLKVFPAPMGTGALGTLAQVAAEVLGLTYDDVTVTWGDTDVNHFEIGSHASRTMYILGNAVYKSAVQLREKVLKRAAEKMEANPDDLEILDKRIFIKGSPDKGITYVDLIREAVYTRDDVEDLSSLVSHRPENSPPPYQAAFAEVEVDTETGHVDVIKMVYGNDCGTIVNPNAVESQLEGGTAMGLGYALWEDPVMDQKTGQVLADDFDTYKIPTALDMPEIEFCHIEHPEPTGPYGAKGVGEHVCVNQSAAIANAIYDAVGVRVWDLPITPEKILKALKKQ